MLPKILPTKWFVTVTCQIMPQFLCLACGGHLVTCCICGVRHCSGVVLAMARRALVLFVKSSIYKKKTCFSITLSVVDTNLSFRGYDMLLISKRNLSLRLNYNARRTLVYNIFHSALIKRKKK
jgi:hypothetical protein